MQIQDIYSQSDMLHLTKDDFDQIKDAVDISTDVDSAEYLYANLNKLLDVELANKIIKNKALAGQISVKWYNFVYEGTLTQESLKARLESEAVGYNVPLRNIDINLVENNIATVYNEENVCLVHWRILIVVALDALKSITYIRRKQKWIIDNIFKI